MTDNDIIKALECCIDCKCKECPCYKNIEGEMRCTEIDEEEILGLINRQKAEIERLQKENHFKELEIEEFVRMFAEIRAGATKEFAERLKDLLNFYDPKCKFVHIHIDNLVKEMTEGL